MKQNQFIMNLLSLVTITVGILAPVWSAVAAVGSDAYLKASNTGSGDNFGSVVAISGDTAVVGAPLEDGPSNTPDASGSAYVYARSGGNWTQQGYLRSLFPSSAALFGSSVAIDGDTIVVGAMQESYAAYRDGTAHVFVWDGFDWVHQARLTAPNPDNEDHFGSWVAISGDVIVVAAKGEDSSATGVNGNQLDNGANDSGAVYVYRRSGDTWNFEAYLKASNTGADDHFGGWEYFTGAVGVSGDTIVVGAPDEDSNATGVNAAVSGGSGTQADNSSGGSGAVYVFQRTAGVWAQQAYIKASITGGGDLLGYSVAIAGDKIAAGAPGEASNATGVNPTTGSGTGANNNTAGNAGAAYVFTRNGSDWSQAAYMKASNTGSGDRFGEAVSISDTHLAVGAPREDSNATAVNVPVTGGSGTQADNSAPDAGAAYVFAHIGEDWMPWAYLKASNAEADDIFGGAVGISGDTTVVGAKFEDSAATGVNGVQTDNSRGDSGAAYTFDGFDPILLPAISALTISEITAGTVRASATVVDVGSSALVRRGVMYSKTNPNPRPGPGVAGNFLNGGGVGVFSVVPGNFAVSLTPATTYYAVAYATNDYGTNYSPAEMFVTAAPTAQEAWRYAHFNNTKNSHTAADMFDADGDGLVNFLEWALGLLPNSASQVPTMTNVSGASIDFCYDRSVDAVAAGVMYSVEWSDTLEANDWSSTGVMEVEQSSDGMIQKMKATVPRGDGDRRFVRLSLSPPP